MAQDTSNKHKFPVLHLNLPSLPIELLIDALPPEKRRLGLFLALAAIAHFLAFSLIKVSYPQPFPRSTPRVYVTLANVVGPASVARANQEFWYMVKDPSLLIRQQSSLVQEGPMEISAFSHPDNHTGLAARLAAKDETVTFLPDDIAPLADRVPAMMNTPHQAFAYATLPATDKTPTTVLSFDSALADRLIPPAPTLPNQPAGLITEAGVTVVRLGIEGDGHVSHALIEQRSGKDSVDATALQFLRKTRFAPASKPGLMWGQVTVYWQFEPEKTLPAAGSQPAPAAP